jgi:hypothetical protein
VCVCVWGGGRGRGAGEEGREGCLGMRSHFLFLGVYEVFCVCQKSTGDMALCADSRDSRIGVGVLGLSYPTSCLPCVVSFPVIIPIEKGEMESKQEGRGREGRGWGREAGGGRARWSGSGTA